MIELPVKKPYELSGETVCAGIAMGEAFLFKPINLMALEKVKLPVEDTSKEMARLDATITKTITQMEQILLQVDHDKDVSDIFQVQLRLLSDRSILEDIKVVVHEQKANIEFALSNQIKIIEEKFHSIQDEVMRTRFLDIQDVYYRILRNLLEIEHVRSNPLKRVKEPIIFVAEKLLPSDIALLDFDKLLGIIMEEGSALSHVAIITKSLGIPTLMNIPGIGSLVRTGDTLIVNAIQGKVVVHPTPLDIEEYRKERTLLSSRIFLKKDKSKTALCKTLDGVCVELEANVGSVKETEEAIHNGASGIGLLRSELFYMSRSKPPTIEEEYDFYAALTSIVKKRPITIRLLDLGADKFLPYLDPLPEQNPQLGIRGIRYLLKTPEIFNRQLRSIARASPLGNIKIVIPFVTTLGDVEQTLEAIGRACRLENVEPNAIRVGIMAEIPSVALSMNSFMQKIDFVNIGTNDLVQYIFAANREDGNVAHYRQSMHPVILKILADIIASANRYAKEASVCGEIASDPFMAPLLVGLGARRLSMQPVSIPLVRAAVARISCEAMKKVVKKALLAQDQQHVMALLSAYPSP
jgi:phosphoenolpyruvate-protein phosphotransferase